MIGTIALGFLLLFVAIALGYGVGTRYGSQTGFLGNLTQAGGGLAYILLFGGLLFLGGAYRIVAFVMVIVGAAVLTHRGGQVKETVRGRING